jgi:(p)ppGpp synthase/HD superfamily hydrolase
MSSLEHAIAIAAEAHRGQKDKAGEPYILHPIRVMLRVSTTEERIAAVLHDLLEDTPWERTDLEGEGFSAEVLDAVEALTRQPHETYEEFLARAAGDPIAIRVKLADLEDNLDTSRLPNPTGRDRRRMAKYESARTYLESISQKI